jgi:hypothetical protein
MVADLTLVHSHIWFHHMVLPHLQSNVDFQSAGDKKQPNPVSK